MEKTITVQCDVPNHEDEKIEYKAEGWKFKHMRLWQAAILTSDLTMTELAELISERVVSWTLTAETINEDGEIVMDLVPFEPGPTALDELEQEVSSWVVLSFKTGYLEAGMPDPNE